jgi:hypothetical protein
LSEQTLTLLNAHQDQNRHTKENRFPVVSTKSRALNSRSDAILALYINASISSHSFSGASVLIQSAFRQVNSSPFRINANLQTNKEVNIKYPIKGFKIVLHKVEYKRLEERKTIKEADQKLAT